MWTISFTSTTHRGRTWSFSKLTGNCARAAAGRSVATKGAEKLSKRLQVQGLCRSAGCCKLSLLRDLRSVASLLAWERAASHGEAEAPKCVEMLKVIAMLDARWGPVTFQGIAIAGHYLAAEA